MKRILLIFLSALLLAFVSCKPKTKYAIVKENIKSYLSKTMHDFNSYEPVQYGPIDSAFTSYQDSEKFNELKDLFSAYQKECEEALQKAESYLYVSRATGKRYSDKGTDYAHKLDSISKLISTEIYGFEPQFVGYKILHSFRGKNMNAATILTTEYFILDSAYNVIKSEEVKGEK